MGKFVVEQKSNRVKERIGVIGAGRFGQLLIDILTEDFNLIYYDVQKIAIANGRAAQSTLEAVASSDTIFLCVPIARFESALKAMLPYVNEHATVLDVLSVKVYANRALERLLPASVSIVPTHPMFGPYSIREGRENLPFVFCPTGRSEGKFEFWKNYFADKKFNIVEMTCDGHDRAAAHTLCVSQMVGRLLEPLELKFTPLDTPHHHELVRLADIAGSDSWELFDSIQTFNPYAREMRQKLKDRLNGLLDRFDHQA